MSDIYFSNLVQDLLATIDETSNDIDKQIEGLSARRESAPQSHLFIHYNALIEAYLNVLLPTLNELKMNILLSRNQYYENCVAQTTTIDGEVDEGTIHVD